MARSELLRRLAELSALDPAAEAAADDAPSPPAHEIAVTGPHRLRARFADGTAAEADLAGLVFQRQALAALRDPAAFATARLADGGHAIRFLDRQELELGADLVPAIAARQAPMTGAGFAAWMHRHGLSANTAADVLGLARRTVVGYRSAAAVPPVVAIACHAFDADGTLLAARFHPRPPGRRRRSPGEAAA